MHPISRNLALLIAVLGFAPAVPADVLTYVDAAGKKVEVEARLAGSGREVLALELADGSIKLVPQGAVTKRVPREGPALADHQSIIARLNDRWGTDRFRGFVLKPYVVGLILSSPLEKRAEGRARSFLRRAARFFKRVESVFASFARRVRFRLETPRYPLVVLIFETDEDFEKHTKEVTGGRGLSAGRIAGFYSGLSNNLVLRLSECATFEVPLHEAIHQQVHNRGVLQRLSPAPAWFNEGIATAFEGNGERINVGPFRISSHYARRSRTAGRIGWDTIVRDDRAFRGDVLAGDAYTHAWSLHWLLITKYKDEYVKFLKMLARQKPLAKLSADDRLNQFKSFFDKTPAAMQKEFPTALAYGLKRQKLPPEKPVVAGLSQTQSNLADVSITAVKSGGTLGVRGSVKNLSPIRPMSFYITVETDTGTYADWYLPDLAINRTVILKPQVAGKRMRGGVGGPGRTFRVRVRAVTPESETARRWKEGKFPVPLFNR